MANLFAQAALSAAFVPVFTDLLQQGKKREAFRLASTLFWIILIVARRDHRARHPARRHRPAAVHQHSFAGDRRALTQIMFPVVLVLGLTGLITGILQSYDEFSIPALAPVLWNVVILVLVVLLHGSFPHNGIESYAIAWLIATVIQGLLIGSALRRIDFRLGWEIDWHDPLVRRVFTLMLPVTLGLGIVNLDALINSSFGALVTTHPRAPALEQSSSPS